jgi:hypothetical protein
MKGEPGKSPTVQWYYKDWLSDRQLQRARVSSRGIWMNLLMYMIDCTTDKSNCKAGRLEYLTIREICSLGGCLEDDAWNFIEDALQHQFCDIELDKNETFHIMSRRLSNDADKRAMWREYKRKQRENNDPEIAFQDDVQCMSTESPPLSPIPTPIPNDVKTNNVQKSTSSTAFKNAGIDGVDFLLTKRKRKLNGKRWDAFKRFWDAFDYKRGKREAADAWIDIPELTNQLVDKIICGAKIAAEERKKTIELGIIPKMAQGWITGKRWEDELKNKAPNCKPQEYFNPDDPNRFQDDCK